MEIVRSEIFNRWLSGLQDLKGKAAILSRIDRLADGNAGDHASVGEGIMEMRIFVGPGYRVYFKRQGQIVAIILCGGDKKSQSRDIAKAKILAKDWSTENG